MYVYDCHGTEPHEFMMKHSSIFGRIVGIGLTFFEKIVVNNSDLIITVTDKQYRMFGVKKNHVVFPMMPTNEFVEKSVDNRYEIRKALGINEFDEVYVYSGQNQKWQMCEETIDIYKTIAEHRSNTRLVIYTLQTQFFKELCIKKGIYDAIIITVAHNEMYRYLDACDFGFCIRNNSIVNQVASPTKILEYVSRNVMPIISDSVGDFSLQFKNNNIGIVWEGKTDYTRPINYDGHTYVQKMNLRKKNEYINAFKKLLTK